MGANNVAAVYGLWSARLREQHKAFRVLAYMALVSKDHDDPPRFFAGRDALVLALGRAPSTKVERHAAHEAVRAAVDELVKCGAIERVVLGVRDDGKPVYSRPGHQAEYRLWIRSIPQGEPVPPLQAHPVPPRRKNLQSLQGEPAAAQGEPVPKEEQEEQELTQEEISSTHVTSGVDRPAAEVIAGLRAAFSKRAAS